MEIGDIAKRINAEYSIDINRVCPMQFYGKLYDEVNEIRSRLANELKNNIPDALGLRC